MTLKQKNIRYRNELLVKDKYYLGGLLVVKKTFKYVKDNLKFKLYVFGIPLWSSYVKPQNFFRLSKAYNMKGGGRYLDCSHYMTQDIARALNEDREVVNKIKMLCEDLDCESIEQVNQIIARLKLSYYLKDKKWFNLINREREELEKIKQEFYPNIIQFGSIWFYNGWFLPINAFEVSVFWHKHGLHKIENWGKIREKNIIDVGGFVGDSAILLQEYTDKKVYSFEAVKNNYELMLKTIELNSASKVVPVKKALGSKKEKLKISINDSGSSIQFNMGTGDIEEVEVITLDEFVRENDIEVGFIKVDIEGFEMEFLRGALQVIKEQKPAMLISIYHQAGDFFGIKPFIEHLNLGYKFKIYKPIDHSVAGEIALFCEVR